MQRTRPAGHGYVYSEIHTLGFQELCNQLSTGLGPKCDRPRVLLPTVGILRL